MTTEMETARTTSLEREIRRSLNAGDICVSPWREGVDYFADLVRHDDGRIVGVVRSPRHEVLPTDYEGTVDFADVLAKEVDVLGLLGQAGVPVPSVLAWRRRSDPQGTSWMLCEHIDHEPTRELNEDQQYELGRIARAIHSIRLDRTVGRSQEPWPSYVLGRITDRLRSAEKYCPALPVETVLSRCAADVPSGAGQTDALLHLDLRPPNLCVREGRIAAVIDVANAITGDPWLELARIRFCGLFTEAFRAGYGLADTDVERQERLLDFYELDIAALLTVVAAEEIDDQELLESSRDRLEHLCAQIVR
ncbi:aminoglycoside phosphotransferase family protein [Streptomyces tuirus]|uniref:Aminoglycoside phosphotransferase family protein n=1 Tax=Streptomyces tuirus TaxID=68278 RepID=A0A941FIV8_9ACTN|nr:aminoglycoside phosphotransferase family protein [Streptomyces tuirus]